jgi:hypothetical protein
LRCDLRWKAACGLGLYGTAFDSWLLAYFRRRLSRSADPQRIFTAVRAVVSETGVLKGKVRRALDSTVLDDAVATQDTVTQIIAAVRRVAREVPGAGEVVAAVCTGHDYADPGKPKIARNDQDARAELVDALVTDAIRVLAALPEREHGPKAADALGLLALVAGQDVEPADGSDGGDGRWGITRGTAPDRVISTFDPQARHVHKTRSHKQDGYKVHLAIEPETGLYTAVAICPGAGPEHHEATVALELFDADERTNELEVYGDTAYSSGNASSALLERRHRLFLKPAPVNTAIPGGYSLDDFAIDTAAGQATCPAGHTVTLAPPAGMYLQRRAVFEQHCAGCELREKCTNAKRGRVLPSDPTTTSRAPPANRPPPTQTGRPPTAAGAHPSNALSPGSCKAATGACATAAPPRTTPGYTPAPPH